MEAPIVGTPMVFALRNDNVEELNLDVDNNLVAVTEWLVNNPNLIANHTKTSQLILEKFSAKKFKETTSTEKIKVLLSDIKNGKYEVLKSQSLIDRASRFFHLKQIDPNNLKFEHMISTPLETLKNELSENYEAALKIQEKYTFLKELFRYIPLMEKPIDPDCSQESIMNDLKKCPFDQLDDKIEFYCRYILDRLPKDNQIKKILQKDYIRRHKEITSQACQMLRNKTPPAKVLLFIAEQRKVLAERCFHHSSKDFGIIRTQSKFLSRKTHINKLYSKDYRLKIVNIVPKGFTIKYKKDFNQDLLQLENVDGMELQTELNGKPITLTRYLVSREYVPNFENDVTFGKSLELFPGAVLLHTPKENVELIMEHIVAKSIQYMETGSKKEQYKLLAEIIWWTAHAMPWERGSASIMEMYVEALAEQHGLTIPLEQLRAENKSLDMEALTTLDINEFVANFLGLVHVND